MVIRMWHGRVAHSDGEAYRNFLVARAIPDYQSVEGNISVKSTHSVDGRLFIGPQPDARDLQNLKSEGIERVINFRRPEEMAKLGFDEAE